jgi:murein DD-endopeptidase MepM/ murein hydrolase activator NlpD
MRTSALIRTVRGRTAHRRTAAAVVLTMCVAALSPPTPARAEGHDDRDRLMSDGGSVSLERDWMWPLRPFRLERPFVAPPHEYGPGHRGIDLAVQGDDVVRAPADGIVAFSGLVAGRGILTIDHGNGLVSTLEPVDTDVSAGARVAAGEPVARVSAGGHSAAGAMHFGVRLDGEYINPLVLLGGVPRAVLLPCC